MINLTEIISLLQVKQGIKPQSGKIISKLNELNLIYHHRNHWVLTSEGQNFIDSILKMGELM